jgi:hypothetical protein
LILYEGPSLLNKAPIVVIATQGSANTKTGDMDQTWILHQDVHPMEALKQGLDAAICGDCQHRRSQGGACYVQVAWAPSQVWKKYRVGGYPKLRELVTNFSGRKVRLGSYGDPAAVPVRIWDRITRKSAGWTGYTHQWRTALHLQPYCMASVDSEEERALAGSMGWRTFRVRRPYDPIDDYEVRCPASQEAGYKTDCATCLACGGTNAKAKCDISIIVHGATAGRFTKSGGKEPAKAAA